MSTKYGQLSGKQSILRSPKAGASSQIMRHMIEVTGANGNAYTEQGKLLRMQQTQFATNTKTVVDPFWYLSFQPIPLLRSQINRSKSCEQIIMK